MISRRTLSIAALAGAAEFLIGAGAKAEASAPRVVAQRLDRIVIVAGNLDRLARFYIALGFVVDDARPSPEHAALARASSATSTARGVADTTLRRDPDGHWLQLIAAS